MPRLRPIRAASGTAPLALRLLAGAALQNGRVPCVPRKGICRCGAADAGAGNYAAPELANRVWRGARCLRVAAAQRTRGDLRWAPDAPPMVAEQPGRVAEAGLGQLRRQPL